MSQTVVNLIEQSLAEKNKEIDESGAALLVEERDNLVAALKKFQKGPKTNSPAVAEDDLLKAVAHCSKNGPALTKDIAKFLGVDSRNIARTLSKHASDGKISGDKDTGYSA